MCIIYIRVCPNMYVCVCPSRPGRRRIPVAELYHLPRESRIGPSLYSFPPFSLVRFTRPEVHALPTFPERRSSWPQRDGRSTTLSSLFHHHLHAPPPSLSLPLTSLSLLFLSLSLSPCPRELLSSFLSKFRGSAFPSLSSRYSPSL